MPRLPSTSSPYAARAASALAGRHGLSLPSLAELAEGLPLTVAVAVASHSGTVREATAGPGLAMAAPPLAAWAAFAHAVAAVPRPAMRAPRWWLPTVFRRWGGHCVRCGCALALLPASNTSEGKATRAYMASVIPPAIGGPDHDGNRVIVCAPCRWHDRDLVDFEGAIQASALTALRAALAETCWNHAVEEPGAARSVPTVRKQFAARWIHERWAAWVGFTDAGAFLAWPTSRAVPTGAFWGMRDLGAIRLPEVNRASGIWLGSHALALDGLWRAINMNGLLRSVTLDSAIDLTCFGARSDWRLGAQSPGAILRLERSGELAGDRLSPASHPSDS